MFEFFSSLLCEIGWLEWVELGISLLSCGRLELGIFLSPGQLGSGQLVSPKGRPKEEQSTLVSFKMLPFLLLPDRGMKGFFFDIYWENLAKLLEVKLTKVWGPSYDCNLEF